jgi:hypothetical protein
MAVAHLRQLCQCDGGVLVMMMIMKMLMMMMMMMVIIVVMRAPPFALGVHTRQRMLLLVQGRGLLLAVHPLYWLSLLFVTRKCV